MNLQFLLSQLDIFNQICANLTFEDGISLWKYAKKEFGMKKLLYRFPIQEIDKHITSLPFIDDKIIQRYYHLRLAGSEGYAYEAIDHNHCNTLQFLIANGLDPNQKLYAEETLLYRAVYRDRPEIVMYLVREGADPKIETYLHGNVLYWAAYSGYLDLIKFLIEEQLMNDQKDLDEALNAARMTRELHVIRYLIERGAK